MVLCSKPNDAQPNVVGIPSWNCTNSKVNCQIYVFGKHFRCFTCSPLCELTVKCMFFFLFGALYLLLRNGLELSELFFVLVTPVRIK